MFRMQKHVDPIPFPETSLIKNPAYQEKADCFDERIHLDIQTPKYIVDLNFQMVSFPYCNKDKDNFAGLAYSLPFKLLSNRGIERINYIIKKNTNLAKQNERNNNIRGLGYISKFIRDFSYSKSILTLFSEMARTPLCLHNCFMNIAQINIGKIGSTRAVDEWHTDSVDYVMVLILSNTTAMIGGELQVLQLSDANGNIFKDLKIHGIPKERVKNIRFPEPGYCILMQGSLIMHSVNPLSKGIEPRMSLINSYITTDVFKQDRTRLSTFRDQSKDPENIANLEYAKHIAWRTRGQLQYVLDNMNYANNNVNDISIIFKNVIQELKDSEEIITKKKKSDLQGFIKIKSKL